jgi:hypothetical protein
VGFAPLTVLPQSLTPAKLNGVPPLTTSYSRSVLRETLKAEAIRPLYTL